MEIKFDNKDLQDLKDRFFKKYNFTYLLDHYDIFYPDENDRRDFYYDILMPKVEKPYSAIYKDFKKDVIDPILEELYEAALEKITDSLYEESLEYFDIEESTDNSNRDLLYEDYN